MADILENICYCSNNKIQTTRQYKYIGFLITPSGEITSGLNDLKARAMKAFTKIKNKTGIFFHKYPLVSLKLFEILVKPILLYASDFGGSLKMPKSNPIEVMHLSFCKQLLGVQKQTFSWSLGRCHWEYMPKKCQLK